MKLYEQKENFSVVASADVLETFLALVASKDITNAEAATRVLPHSALQALHNFGPKDIEVAIAEARKGDHHDVILEKTTEKPPAPAPVPAPAKASTEKATTKSMK